jgi:hypothetical protein
LGACYFVINELINSEFDFFLLLFIIMTETFRQYIKIRTFLGYRPKEILLELQNAFGACEKIFINNIRKKYF